MLRKELVVRAKGGLRGANLEKFTRTAGEFDSRIDIESSNMDKIINAKSIMGMMSLAIKDGDSIMLVINGSDENEALDALTHLVESGFKA